MVAGGGFELQSRIDPTQLIDSAMRENAITSENGNSLLHFSYTFQFPVPAAISCFSVVRRTRQHYHESKLSRIATAPAFLPAGVESGNDPASKSAIQKNAPVVTEGETNSSDGRGPSKMECMSKLNREALNSQPRRCCKILERCRDSAAGLGITTT